MIRLFFETFPVLAWLLSLLTVVCPLRLRWRGAVALALVLLLASQKFVIYHLFGGDAFVPRLPELFVNATGWAYSSFMLLVLFSLLPPWKWWRPRAVVLACLALALAGWGIWEGVRVPDVKRVELSVQGLPAAFDGLRLVQLSDLHCSPAARKARTQGIVDAVNALKPDLVCITGDFVDGSVGERADDLSPLRDLRARLGVFGCPGNHEYYSDYAAWRPVYESFGVHMLDNAHVVFTNGSDRLVLGGVTDFAAADNRFGARFSAPDVKQAFRGAPANTCRILLQHRPIFERLNAGYGVRLQLSGHTHGGALLGFDLLVARMGNHGHVRGLYHFDDIDLYVNSGTGQWAGFPLRLGVPAEITEFILHPASGEPTVQL